MIQKNMFYGLFFSLYVYTETICVYYERLMNDKDIRLTSIGEITVIIMMLSQFRSSLVDTFAIVVYSFLFEVQREKNVN